jgi:hypothetical protein
VNKNDSREFKLWVIEHDAAYSKPYTDRAYAVKGHVTLARNMVASLSAQGVCTSPDDSRAKKCPLKNVCFNLEVK